MPNLQTGSGNRRRERPGSQSAGPLLASEEEVKIVRKLREKLTDEVRRERKKQDARKAVEGEDKLDAMVRRSIEIHGP
jgi:hypothetical protein